MIVELWRRKRDMQHEDENDVEDTSRGEKSGEQIDGFGWEDIMLVTLHGGSELVSAIAEMIN
jgi:hypothetical protein